MVNPMPQVELAGREKNINFLHREPLVESALLFSKDKKDEDSKPPKGFEKFWNKASKKEES